MRRRGWSTIDGIRRGRRLEVDVIRVRRRAVFRVRVPLAAPPRTRPGIRVHVRLESVFKIVRNTQERALPRLLWYMAFARKLFTNWSHELTGSAPALLRQASCSVSKETRESMHRKYGEV